MSAADLAFATRLRDHADSVAACLAALLGTEPKSDEIARPAPLLGAMRHGVLNGGKRLRPFLVMESAALFAGPAEVALRVGAALECVHCYSLVHDDLPAMDDDDLRRGQPTVHVVFGEANAILAGDSLLTLAFDILADSETGTTDSTKVQLVAALARASGLGGMAGGQALDLMAETEQPDEDGIVRLQAMKTGALIRFACEAGAILSQAGAEDRASLRRFGEIIGRAFQLADDLLDLTADAATLGKATGKDAQRGKATLVARRGRDWAEAELARLVEEASAVLAPYGARADVLLAAARFVANRTH